MDLWPEATRGARSPLHPARLSEDRNVSRIAAEVRNIIANPPQHLLLVQPRVVSGTELGKLSRKILVREEGENVQAKIERNNDDRSAMCDQ